MNNLQKLLLAKQANKFKRILKPGESKTLRDNSVAETSLFPAPVAKLD